MQIHLLVLNFYVRIACFLLLSVANFGHLAKFLGEVLVFIKPITFGITLESTDLFPPTCPDLQNLTSSSRLSIYSLISID